MSVTEMEPEQIRTKLYVILIMITYIFFLLRNVCLSVNIEIFYYYNYSQFSLIK